MMKRRRSSIAIACLVAQCVGLAVAAAMMYAAWEHNPQGTIHDEEGVNWGYWLSIGALWSLATGVPLALALSGIAVAFQDRKDGAGRG